MLPPTRFYTTKTHSGLGLYVSKQRRVIYGQALWLAESCLKRRLHSMRRREFIGLLGGSAMMWPAAARAQQKKIPKVGILYPGLTASAVPRVAAFREEIGRAHV